MFAGAVSTVTGLSQTNYIFRRIKENFPGIRCQVISSFSELSEDFHIFVWEAFISNSAKHMDRQSNDSHIEDARVGLNEYSRLRNIGIADTKAIRNECTSLIGAILIRTSCSNNLKLLSKRPLVVKPN